MNSTHTSYGKIYLLGQFELIILCAVTLHLMWASYFMPSRAFGQTPALILSIFLPPRGGGGA